jgi:hypothetical protein
MTTHDDQIAELNSVLVKASNLVEQDPQTAGVAVCLRLLFFRQPHSFEDRKKSVRRGFPGSLLTRCTHMA